MLACLFVVLTFGDNQTLTVRDLFSQMRVSNERVQTLEGRFVSKNMHGGRFTRNGAEEVKSWSGTVRFRSPLEFRIDFVEDGVSATSILHNSSTEYRRLNQVNSSGMQQGVIDKPDVSVVSSVSGLSTLVMATQFDWWARTIPFEKWSVTKNGNLLHIKGPRDSSGRRDTLQWDVDPQRGFILIKEEYHHFLPDGELTRTTTYDYVEATPGLWVPSKVHACRVMNGTNVGETTVEFLPDSLFVNRPLPNLEITFPKGTFVEDRLHSQAYVEGGATTRDRASLEKLATEARQFAADHPETAKPGSTSTVPPTSFAVPQTVLPGQQVWWLAIIITAASVIFLAVKFFQRVRS